MATPQTRSTLLLLLTIGLLVSGALATKVELDKRRLASAYAKAQAALAQLEQERAHLAQELTQARQTLEDRTGELAQLQTQLERTEQSASQLRLEQARLQNANVSLADQLTAATQAKRALEAKLSSLKELQAAIRSIKEELWQEHRHAWLRRIEEQRAADQRKLAHGNRGFVVRHGAPTLGSPTRLQVRVHEPQAQ